MTRSQRSHDPFTPLRAVSCVSVMLAHTVSDLSVVFSGTMAVAFFLALSGYLITKNVMGQIEPQFDEAPKFFGGRLLLKYMIRRFFRLYPCFIVVAFIHSYELFGGCPLIDVLLLKVPFEHLWTMKVEILVSFKHVPIYFTLYSMLMIGMAKVLPKPLYKGFKVLYHAFVCSLPFVFTHYRKDICDLLDSYDSLWVQRNIFFYGVAGGIISHYMKICKLTPKLDTPLKKGILATIAYALLYGIYLTNPGTQWNLFRIGGGWPDGTIWWRALLPYVVVYASFINCMEYMPETSYIMQFLNLKYIQLIGKASYSLYLIHKIPITLLKRYTNVINTDLFVYDFVGSLILGGILYNLVEYPCIILSQKAVVLSEKLLDQSKEYIVKKTGNWSSVQLSDEEVQSISTP